MTWRHIIVLVSLSACASTVWKNDLEVAHTNYSDQLMSYDLLNEKMIRSLKLLISQKLLDLIDHANNASNKTYASSFRSYSREKVRTILNISDNKAEGFKTDAIIQQIGKASFEQFLIRSPELDEDSIWYSHISLQGKDIIKAQIKPKLKLFAPDTVSVWEVDFIYLGAKTIN